MYMPKTIIAFCVIAISIYMGHFRVYASPNTDLCNYYVPFEFLIQLSNGITRFEDERCKNLNEFCGRPVSVFLNIERPKFESDSNDNITLNMLDHLNNDNDLENCINLKEYKRRISRKLGSINNKIRFQPNQQDDKDIEEIIEKIEEYGPGGVERSSINRLKRRHINYYIKLYPTIILNESDFRDLSSESSNSTFKSKKLNIFQIKTYELSGEILTLDNYDKVYLSNFSESYDSNSIYDLRDVFDIDLILISKSNKYNFEFRFRALNKPLCIDSKIHFSCRLHPSYLKVPGFYYNYPSVLKENVEEKCNEIFQPIKLNRPSEGSICYSPKDEYSIPFAIKFEAPPYPYDDGDIDDLCYGDENDPYECRWGQDKIRDNYNSHKDEILDYILNSKNGLKYSITIRNESDTSATASRNIKYIKFYNK